MLLKSEYIVGEFIEEDVEDRVEKPVYDYLVENDLLDEVILHAVDWLRGWSDDYTDKEYEAIESALKKVIGERKLGELEAIAWEEQI